MKSYVFILMSLFTLNQSFAQNFDRLVYAGWSITGLAIGTELRYKQVASAFAELNFINNVKRSDFEKGSRLDYRLGLRVSHPDAQFVFVGLDYGVTDYETNDPERYDPDLRKVHSFTFSAGPRISYKHATIFASIGYSVDAPFSDGWLVPNYLSHLRCCAALGFWF
jgi:hypothetical protein